jgi:Rieske Fe-S protein
MTIEIPPRAGVTRRAALVAGAAGVGTVTLAACGSGGTPSAAAGAGGSVNPASVTGGQRIATLDDIAVGEAVKGTLSDGSHVLVARPSASTAACFSAICTHMGCTVAPAGTELKCPCHGSIYNATTGAVIRGPAPRALNKLTVHVAGGEVVTGPGV